MEGVIEWSTSYWAVPIVLVQKTDGTHPHFCGNYRKLNGQSKHRLRTNVANGCTHQQINVCQVPDHFGFGQRLLAGAIGSKQ